MDSRSKIIETARLAELARAEKLRIVRGYFDVLTAQHVRRLKELSGGARLAAWVEDPPAPVLNARSRAELIAALDAVDYVVIANGAPLPESAEIVEEIAADEERFRALVRHVHGRQNA